MLGVALVLKLLGKKVIYHIGDDNPSLIAGALIDRLGRFSFLYDPVKAILSVVEGLSIKMFDCTVVLTKSLKNDRLVFTDKIISLYYYPDPSFRNAIPAGKREYIKHSMVYVGAISKRKGLAEMFEVFRQVKRKYADSTLLLVGALPDVASKNLLETYLNDSELKNSIITVGKLPHNDLPPLISKSAIGKPCYISSHIAQDSYPF
jgi:glycosyltransferase involved in cell wall biosynthesis